MPRGAICDWLDNKVRTVHNHTQHKKVTFREVSCNVIISNQQFPRGFGAASLGPQAPGRSNQSCQYGLWGKLVPISAHMKTFLCWFIFRPNLKQISTLSKLAGTESGCTQSEESWPLWKWMLFCFLLGIWILSLSTRLVVSKLIVKKL